MIAATPETFAAFDNILFATDLSHGADAALPYLIEIARAYGSMVHAVHIKTAWSVLQKNELDCLDERLGDIPHEMLIESGTVTTTLLDLAARKGINLIVLATHGRNGLDRAILGSLAETIFRQAPCPVMTVGPRLCADPATLLTHEILCATDLTPASASVTRYALALARKNQGNLTILTVLPVSKSLDPPEGERRVTLALRQLGGLIPAETPLPCRPYCIVEQGEPAEKIIEAARTYDAGLIVLGIRPHSIGMATHISRRTAHEVVTGAPCPVLAVPGFAPAPDLEIYPVKVEDDLVEMPQDPVFV